MRPLGAQGGVVAVTGVYNCIVVETVEDLTFQIVHQGCEVFGIVGFARPSGEETVPSEQMSHARARIRERDRTWRVPNQPNHVEPLCAQFDLITVPDPDHALDPGAGADCLEIRLAAHQSGSSGSGDRA